MANTIIQLKNSGIPGNVPSILQPGELAINYTDGKLFYGNSINVATLFDAITEPSGLNGEIQFNDSGVFGASANLKFDSPTNTLIVDAISSHTTNIIFNHANVAFGAGNSAAITAQAGFDHANGAFSTANAKYNSAGGEISGDVVITGNLTISGSQTIVRASNLATNDNMIYLNEARTTTVTNVVGNGTNVIYTTSTDHGYTTGMFIGVTGITPSSLNLETSNTIIGVTANTFTVASTVTDTYVSGGTARAKSAVNPDLGFSGGYYDGTYHHAGLFRDATDGTWKFFDNYVPEPDVSPYIDTDHASFRLAKLTANLVTDVISVRGVDPLDRANAAYGQANSATTTAQAGFNHANGAFSAANTKFDSTGGSISGNIAVAGIITINTHAVLESTTITTASISQTT
jgi:hypothetical protein